MRGRWGHRTGLVAVGGALVIRMLRIRATTLNVSIDGAGFAASSAMLAFVRRRNLAYGVHTARDATNSPHALTSCGPNREATGRVHTYPAKQIAPAPRAHHALVSSIQNLFSFCSLAGADARRVAEWRGDTTLWLTEGLVRFFVQGNTHEDA
jgi:hypothetical protein